MLKLVVLIASWLALAGATETCPADQGPVRCSTCTRSGFTDVNVMTTLPRITYVAGVVSSNVAAYDVFVCPDATNPDTPCEISPDLAEFSGVSSLTSPSQGSLIVYGHGVLGYVAFAVVCAVILPLLACLFCCCRCGLLTCVCGSYTGCSWCGYGVPSPKKPDSWCCTAGFVELSDPLGPDSIGVVSTNPVQVQAGRAVGAGPAAALEPASSSSKAAGGKSSVTHDPHTSSAPADADLAAGAAPASGPRFHYTPAARWVPRICLLLSFLCVVAFGVMQYTLGSAGLAPAIRLVASAADSLTSIGGGMYNTITDLAIDVSADVVKPLVLQTNATIHLQSDPNVIVDSIICVAGGVDDTQTSLTRVSNNLTAVQISLDNVSTALTLVDASLLSINTSLGGVAALKTGQLRSDIVSLGSFQTDAPAVLAQADTAVAAIEEALNNLTSPTTGLPATRNALTWYTNRPSTAAANQSSSDLKIIAEGGAAGAAGASFRVASLTRLDSLRAASANLTRVPELVGLLRGLSAQVDSMRSGNLTGALLAALNDVETLLGRAPNVNATLDAANATIVLLESLASELDVVSGHVESLRTAVQSTNLDFINDVDGLFNTADEVLACANAMTPHLDGISATVVKLPSAISDITGQLSSMNATIADARASFDDAKSLKTTYDDQTAALNFDSYLQTLSNASAALDVAQLKNLTAEAPSLGGSITSVNVTALREQVLAVDARLSDSSVTVNATTLNEVESISPVFGNVTAAADSAAAALRTYHQKRCTPNGQICTNDGDCTSGTCFGGQGKCIDAATGDAPTGSATTPDCTSNNDCASGQVCSFDPVTMTVASVAFSTYASTAAPSLGNSTSALDSLSTAVEGVSDVSSARGSITDLQASLGSVAIDTSSAVAQIDSAADQAASTQGTVQGIRGSVADAQASLSVADSLDSAQSLVSSALSAVQSASSAIQPIINGGKASLLRARDFWYQRLGSLMEESLSRTALTAARARGGLSEVVLVVAGFVDELLTLAKDVGGAFGSSDLASTLSFNATEQAKTYRGVMDAAGDATAMAQGGFYYAFSVFLAANDALNLMSLDVGLIDASGSVFADANGALYPDHQICLTSSCLDRTVDILVTSDLTGAQTEVSSALTTVDNNGGSSSSSSSSSVIQVPVSASLAIIAPVILPLLVTLLGLLPVCLFCNCKCQPCCVRCLTCTHQIVTCCCASCLFLIAGAILFPLVMVFADGCRSGPNIGFVFVDQSEAFLCDVASGTLTTPGSCAITVDAGTGTTSQVSLNLPRLYAALLAQGGCDDVGRAEVTTSFTALSSFVSKQLDDQVNKTVVPTLDNYGMQLQPPMLSVVNNGTDLMTAAASNLLTNLGSQVLSCDNVNNAANAVYDGVCCGVTTPMYWFASTFYLMAFALCCCGWYGSMLGFKRLPNELTGEMYKAAMDQPREKRERRLNERNAQRGSMIGSASRGLGLGRASPVAPAVTEAATRAVDGEDFAFDTPIRAANTGTTSSGARQPLMKPKKTLMKPKAQG